MKRVSFIILPLFFLFIIPIHAVQAFSLGSFFKPKQAKKENTNGTEEIKLLSKKFDLAMVKGMEYYTIGKFQNSIKVFDLVDKGYNRKKSKENVVSKILTNALEVAANDCVFPYIPWMYERIMVNTMKAVDYMLSGDFDHTRIEFNRALVRELKAEEEFRKEIERQLQEIKKEAEKGKKNNKSVYNEESLKKTFSFIEKYYSNLGEFKAYSGFLNPFTDYIAGIYFLNQGDVNKATNLLKRCYGMVKDSEPASKLVKQDFYLAFKTKSSLRKKNKHFVWIVFLNGEIGRRVEKRIDIPLFIFTHKVMYTGLALPDIKDGKISFPYLEYRVGNQRGKTLRLVDFDRLEKTEFKKRLQAIAFRAIVRAMLFTIAQDKTGTFGATLIGGYHFLMNHADTRQWRNMPKEVQIARIRMPVRKNTISIFKPGGELIKTFKINPNKNVIVFVNAIAKDEVTVHKIEI